ncbi:MAG TPA: hypothetical protein VE779_06800, partial [Candidatus Angelobacter sp.]|nr:hypothetical protein [Candidatus Angelobacter sp.]
RIVATVCLAALLAPAASAQGFGSAKTKITLHRKLPPVAHLNGAGISVQVTGHTMQTADAADLRNMVEAELLKDDHRLRSEDRSPDSIIVCTITEYVPPTAQTATHSTYVVGSKKPQQEQVTRYSGILKLAYVAKDAHSGRTLDSNNITSKYDDEFNQYGSTSKGISESLSTGWNKLKHGKFTPDKPPTAGELRDVLFSDAVSQIAARLVNTDEPVEVLLARGKLDDANKLAEADLWTRNLENLETMTPFPSKEDDAYRLYNIGVAYEALAYGAEDNNTARKYLDEAAINYGKAIDDKPSEKYFMEPQKRIDTAIAHYKALHDQPKSVTASDTSSTPASSDAAKSAGSGRSSTKSGTGATKTATAKTTAPKSTTAASTPAKSIVAPAPKKPSGPPLTNDQVIQMVKAGLDEDNVIDTIKSAGSVNFDLSVDGQVKLAQNGVKGKILTAMKTKARSSASAH